jgi:hypothetical protein
VLVNISLKSKAPSMRAIMLAAALLTPTSVTAQASMPDPQAPLAAARSSTPDFERDRTAILAQAGQFHVRFEMRETVSFQADYEPLEEKLSGGSEIVRVIRDEGDQISLQHILVMEHEGRTVVVKHWRQDWVYQPREVLTYAGPDTWRLVEVPEVDRTGAWSQTVWQTDDSPRYGGVGRWTYQNGLVAWTSGPTWRPLARRDAVRNPVYDRYLGTNRHVLTPSGWVHIQDNIKMAGPSGSGDEPRAVVQEDVVNTYERSSSWLARPGDDYWAATRDYWAEVRGLWEAAIAARRGVTLEEQASAGSVTGTPLMDLAARIESGELTTPDAVDQAQAIVSQATAVR